MARVFLVAGLGFGDEGKGRVVSHLAMRSPPQDYSDVLCVVRYNGGGQAGHNVILPDGRHHTFSQFGSGSFTPGCQTHLSRYMMVSPGAMLSERLHLQQLGVEDIFKRTTIEDAALVTTRFQVAANRLREMHRDLERHGSCGMGVEETVLDSLSLGTDALFARDIRAPGELRTKLQRLQDLNRGKIEPFFRDIPKSPARDEELRWLADVGHIEIEAQICELLAERVQIVEASWLDKTLRKDGVVIFEGAQGALLDQRFGFLPYCTRSNTTFENAFRLMGDAPDVVIRIGVLRSYLVRHGPGPMPTEDTALQEVLPDAHNGWNTWQRSFRVGYFDGVLLRYALSIMSGVDEIAVTHMDKLPPKNRFCWGYDVGSGKAAQLLARPTNEKEQRALTELMSRAKPLYSDALKPAEFLRKIEDEVCALVTLASYGPSFDKMLTPNHLEDPYTSAILETYR